MNEEEEGSLVFQRRVSIPTITLIDRDMASCADLLDRLGLKNFSAVAEELPLVDEGICREFIRGCTRSSGGSGSSSGAEATARVAGVQITLCTHQVHRATCLPLGDRRLLAARLARPGNAGALRYLFPSAARDAAAGCRLPDLCPRMEQRDEFLLVAQMLSERLMCRSGSVCRADEGLVLGMFMSVKEQMVFPWAGFLAREMVTAVMDSKQRSSPFVFGCWLSAIIRGQLPSKCSGENPKVGVGPAGEVATPVEPIRDRLTKCKPVQELSRKKSVPKTLPAAAGAVEQVTCSGSSKSMNPPRSSKGGTSSKEINFGKNGKTKVAETGKTNVRRPKSPVQPGWRNDSSKPVNVTARSSVASRVQARKAASKTPAPRKTTSRNQQASEPQTSPRCRDTEDTELEMQKKRKSVDEEDDQKVAEVVQQQPVSVLPKKARTLSFNEEPESSHVQQAGPSSSSKKAAAEVASTSHDQELHVFDPPVRAVPKAPQQPVLVLCSSPSSPEPDPDVFYPPIRATTLPSATSEPMPASVEENSTIPPGAASTSVAGNEEPEVGVEQDQMEAMRRQRAEVLEEYEQCILKVEEMLKRQDREKAEMDEFEQRVTWDAGLRAVEQQLTEENARKRAEVEGLKERFEAQHKFLFGFDGIRATPVVWLQQAMDEREVLARGIRKLRG